MMSSNQLPFSEVIEFYKSEETQSVLDQFLNQVEHFFKTNPTLKRTKAIHSIKARQKDPEHLRDKLLRKQSKGVIITKDIACREQIRVLAKLVSTGTRLADSIFRTYDDYMRQEKK